MITHAMDYVVSGAPDPETFTSDRQPRLVFAYGCQTAAADSTQRTFAHGGFGWSLGSPDEIAVASGGITDFGLDDSGNGIFAANFSSKQGASDLGGTQLAMTRLCRPDGFEWDKGTASYVSQMIARMEVAGGTNLECYSGTLSSPTAAEGATTRAVTGVGFEPQAIILLWAKTPWFTPASAVSWGGPAFGMGAASSSDSSEQWAFQTQNGYLSLGNSTTALQRAGVCFAALGNVGNVCTGTLVSMDADGFTIDFNREDTRDGGAFGYDINGRLIGFLALRDTLGGFKVGTGYQAASTGPDSVVSGLSFAPQGVLRAHVNCADVAAIHTTRGPWHVGMSDGASEANILNGRIFGHRMAPTAITFADAGTTVVAEATCSLDPDGFTLDWSSTDATARPFGWVAMATEGFSPDCPARSRQQIYRRVRS